MEFYVRSCTLERGITKQIIIEKRLKMSEVWRDLDVPVYESQ